MKKIALTVLGLVVALVSIKAQGTITVIATDVESDKGEVYFMLHREADDTFPDGMEKSFQVIKKKAQKGDVAVSFENIPFGEYAISIAHDKDGNGEIKKSFIGMPKEPIGASNMQRFGKPSWRKSKFQLTAEQSNLEHRMKFIN